MKENNKDFEGQPSKNVPIEFEDISSHSNDYVKEEKPSAPAQPTKTPAQKKPEPAYKRGQRPIEDREIVYPNKFVEFLLKNNKRNTKIILGILIALILALVIFAVAYIKGKLDLITVDPGNDNYTGTSLAENFEDNEFQAVHDVSDATSLDDLLSKWYNLDSELMSQDYILNVLLLGVDSSNGQVTGGRSDVMMLVSLNKKTKKITLVSIMRDSRIFMNASGARTGKLNTAYFYGGPAAAVDCIERNLKIDIDYYVAVDFVTFPKLIDALGGVTVDMKQYEQEYINRTTSAIKKIPNYGKVTLNGKQALVYSRIRKCDADSDVSRTRRQRQVITAIIKSASGASSGQLNNALNQVLPHVRTDMSKSKIFSYGTQALSQGWMDYDIEQLTMPTEEARADAMIGGISYWVVDWPLVAQETQTALYGKTNIELDANRATAFDYVKYNHSSSGGSSSGSDSTQADVSGDETTIDENPVTEPPVEEETTTRRVSIFDGIFGKPTEAPTDAPTDAPATDAPTDAPMDGEESPTDEAA